MLIKDAPKPIKKLLVANRGEIAIRILRAASELGITTVAIYTYEDRYSLHRYKADEAYQIGKPSEPLKPYLDIEEILSIAKENQVDAIHPGYGFLSENVQFAKRCEEEGIIFVGPSWQSMEALGDKITAKKVAQQLQIPMITGNEQPLTSVEIALIEAEKIGYPVMLKATAGGGGRGMRVCYNPDELSKAFIEASSEALKAFGNNTLFLEKFIHQPKHIEVQILGDQQGNLVHLFERDCSVQRRFQKVVEIAPAPNLSQETKNLLYGYALKLAKHVHYYNAGTVEFLVDSQENIYFIEVNPRIQVEHTVTEVVTGIDLVRTQILIAMGLPLSHPNIFIHQQNDITCKGYAIQCRITTEDPKNNFQPDFGKIIAYRNAGGFGIRLDEGSTYAGVQISPFFDSMLVKITASGRTLKGACQRMDRTLREFRIRGVKTNIPFLQNVIAHPTFQSGKATVHFIDNTPELLEYPVTQDRGTKTLQYIAEVIVNGNPYIQEVNPNKIFQPPIVPDYNRFSEYPKGTKQLLTELGPTKFCQWLKNEKVIHYTDTTFRDAHQSLLATRVRTIDMLKVAESFAKHHPQTFSMEVWGGATFDVALRFLQECPWQRLQLLRKAIPNILLQMLIRGANAVGYSAYPDNLVEKFIEKAWQNGIDIFRIFDSLNWIENMKTSIQAVKERTNAIAEVCICYTGDILNPNRPKYNLQYYLDLAKKIEDLGAHILCIKDMAGLLKPYAAEVLIRELKKCIDIPIHLHTHDTSGAQIATYLKAIENGVDVIDVALASMSGLTSQPSFNTMVAILERTPRENPYNLDSLNQFSYYWELVREYYYPFESGLMASTAEVYEHEIPGGQYSNLKPQAYSLGLADRFQEVKKNFAVVNQLFGDIVKVTPSSKVVGDMALFMTIQNLTVNDIFERGHEISFPESVISMMKGDLGQPEWGFPKELQKIILKNIEPYTDRPNAHLKPIDFDADFQAFQNRFGKQFSELDYLSYKFYPKVFEEYAQKIQLYGNVSVIPTPVFFYGLKPDEECVIEIDKGKTLLIKYLYTSPANEEGIRTVYFKLNGQTRSIEVQDKSLVSLKKENPKASGEYQIGSPLQGLLSKILVKENDFVQFNQPLFIIEAMKMETTVTANFEGTIEKIHLKEGSLVQTNDLIISWKV